MKTVRPRSSAHEPVAMKNIGPTIRKRLAEIDVMTIDDLAVLGSAEAYQRLATHFAGQRLPVCYYLYSLEGALQDRHWDDFSEDEKHELRQHAGLED